MTPAEGSLDAALAPLDHALRSSVAAVRAASLASTRREVDAHLAAASRDGEALVEQARRDGEALADATLASYRARLRRDVAATVLDARRAITNEIAERVRAAVLALRDASDYPVLLDGLAARVRAQLGAGAIVVRDPPGVGGVIGERDGRRVEYTLPVLAALVLADMGDEIEALL
ncbi:MAG TPA: hypothetical protein VN636_11405 [Acidimicrobiia bacterium]|nr:hypothetical protein [Acidimicrobiia bacterium]